MKQLKLSPLQIAVSAFLGWAALILVLAAVDLFWPDQYRVPWPAMSFEKSGQFGDSFGVISAAMAAVAAYFAYQTYQASQAEVELLRKRSAEPTFLNLLERRFNILNNIILNNVEGVKAIKSLASGLRQDAEHNYDIKTQVSKSLSPDKATGLRNYFRYTFHIVRFAEELFG